jgi:AcrR family transcriptional regulator
MNAKKKHTPSALQRSAKRLGAGRPRSIESHDAILAAALKLLHENGYRSVTMEGIASEAAVGKQTIYRWWKSKAEVILEAFARHTADRFPVPHSGDLQTDLQVFLTQVFASLSQESGVVVRGLMSEALIDRNFAEAMRDIFIASRRSALRDILSKGIERGELASDVDIELIIDLIYGPMWYRLLNQHAPLNPKFAKQISEIIVGKLTRSE